MEPFVPEMSRYWLAADEAAGRASDRATAANAEEVAALREREALEALAGRVSAARCVV